MLCFSTQRFVSTAPKEALEQQAGHPNAIRRLTQSFNEPRKGMAAARESKARWVSSRRSKRTRSLPNPANHAWVRSTTQRYIPRRSLLSIPFRAMRAVMRCRGKSARHRRQSYPLSACNFSGRFRGRPSRPHLRHQCSPGISRSGRAPASGQASRDGVAPTRLRFPNLSADANTSCYYQILAAVGQIVPRDTDTGM